MKVFQPKRIFLFLCAYIVCVFSNAQDRDSIDVVQYISDAFTKHGITDAHVTLADTNGIQIDTFRTERQNGSNKAYWFGTVARKSQTFMVKVEHPDYESVVKRIVLDKPARLLEYNFPELFMKRKMKETTLNEVAISATRVQIAYKGDTIVVNAQAFKIPEGSMLDALVASVPGAELRDDGTIYMNGRKVDYLTLNGKDFFKGRNRMMLDNLPYYIVNKLKFYEKDMPYSQMIHKDTGVKDYVMDVEMKREYSIGYTANAEAGIGTNDKWMARLFGLRFSDNSRLVLFAGANNTNEIRPPGGEGWHEKSKVLTGEKEIKMVGGSFNVDDKNGRYNENAEATINWTDNRDEMRTSRETFLSGGSEYGRAHDVSRNKDFSASLSNKLVIKRMGVILNTTGNYCKQDGNGLSRSASFSSDPSAYGSCMQILDSVFVPIINSSLQSINVNDVSDQTRYNSKNNSFQQSIDWDKELPWGDYVNFSASVDCAKSTKEVLSNYILTYSDTLQARNRQYRVMPYSNHGYSYNLHGSYDFHMLDYWNIYIGYDYTQQYSNTESSLYRLDKLGVDIDYGVLPSRIDFLKTIDINNSYRSHYMIKTHKANLGFGHDYYGEKCDITFRVSASIVHKIESVLYWRSMNFNNLRRSNFYIEPYAWFYYANKKGCPRWLLSGINFKYESTVQTPNLVQLLDVEDTVNPLAITKGNANLKTSRNHNLELKMNNGGRKRYCLLYLGMNFLQDLVANGFTYNPQNGVYTYCPENVNGNWNAQVSPYFRMNLDKENHYQLESKTGFNYVHNVDLAMIEGFNTSQLSRVNHFVTSENLKISYNKNVARMELVGTFAWNVVDRQYANSNNINAFDFSYGISGQYTFPWKIQLATDLKMYNRRGYEESSMNTDELVWNASLSRPFLKGKLLVKVDAFDILGQLSNTRYTVNGQGRTETWQLCMPRYAMLRVSYRFNSNLKRK